MIFDFYLSCSFNLQNAGSFTSVSFRKEPFYRDIIGNEVRKELPDGYALFLHRRKWTDSFAEDSDLMLWIFGFVFTNQSYAASQGENPRKLNAQELLAIRRTHPGYYRDAIKGSYVLILYDKKENVIELVTDRLNVLPLYYAYADGRLVVSSNTAMILKNIWVNREIDPLSMAMQGLFDYMLGEHYFFKGIRRCENARIYRFSKEGMSREAFWDVSELYHETLLPKNESLNLLAEQLKKNVALYTSDTDKFLLSLTGGFDGRTNLAVLDRPKEDYLCYSYGMPGSKQIRVPQDIAKKLDIHYRPIELETEFLDSYYENSKLASYFSNGTAPIGFCNIPYAFKKLSAYSDTIITGLFGSEILRPIHNNGIQINDKAFDIFLSDDSSEGLEKALQKVKRLNLIESRLLSDSYDGLLAYFNEHYFQKYQKFDSLTRLFFFTIQEGIRKYFSQEISIERVFVSTRFPYFDTDLVDLIYKTSWAGMYNGFLGESKFKRRKGQMLYAHIMKKYKPELGKILLDRGYCSNDLLLPFPINYLKVAFGVYCAKKYMKNANGNDTFKTEVWSKEPLKQILEKPNTISENVFANRLENALQSHTEKFNFLTFRHLVAIKQLFSTIL